MGSNTGVFQEDQKGVFGRNTANGQSLKAIQKEGESSLKRLQNGGKWSLKRRRKQDFLRETNKNYRETKY